MKKKKEIIPGNPGEGIALFNQALGNGSMTEGLYNEIKGKYTDEEIDEACEALRAEYVSDFDMLQEFKEKVSQEYIDWMNDVYNGKLDSEVVDAILWDICFTLDPRFIKKYLEDHFSDTIEEDYTLSYKPDIDGFEFEHEISYKEINDFLDHKFDRIDLALKVLSEATLNEEDREYLEYCTDGANIDDPSSLDNWELESLADGVFEIFEPEQIIDLLDLDDELKDYYLDEMHYLYQEAEWERKDPYGYRGLSRSDFF